MRGDLRAGADRRGRRDHRRPGRRRRRAEQGVPVPEGRLVRVPRRRPRPAAHPPRAPRRQAAAGELGGGVRGGTRGADQDHRGARARRGRDLPGQPQRAHDRRRALRRGAAQGARVPQRLHRLDRGPDAQARLVRVPVRAPAQRAGTGHRPDRLPDHPRRRPVHVQRQPLDGARRTRPAQGAACPGRAVRGGGPAAQPDRAGGRPVRADPSRYRRVPAARHGARAVRPGPGAAGPARRPRDRGRGGPGAGRAVPPGGGGAALRGRRDDHPRADRPARRRTPRGGLWPDRYHHGRARHGHELAGRRAQRADRQPRPAGRSDVPAAGDVPPGYRPGQGVHRRALAQPGPGAARGARRVPRRHATRPPGTPT